MVEPEFGFTARLAELIDEAQDPAKAVGRPLSDEEIIDLLEETTLILRMEFLKPGGSRRR